MPVDRSYIDEYAYGNPDLFNALTALADASDENEQAAGLASGTAATPQPPQAWAINAANGHYQHAITPPAGTPPPAVQYELQSGTNQLWDVTASVADYVLGLGQTTLDVVDPGTTKFWRCRWRSVASPWSQWQTYATSAGVVSLSSGTLYTG